MKKDETIIENGSLVKHKLTGAIGIVVDNAAILKNADRHKMNIFYNAEGIHIGHLAGKNLFNYSGKTCFREYSYAEEVEVVEKKGRKEK